MTQLLRWVPAVLLFSFGNTAQAEKPVDGLAKAPSHFAKVGDLRVHYKRLGRGRTALVYVHGWTCNLTFWDAQVPAFQGKIRQVLLDLPGHGQSDKPKIEYSIDLFARAANAVLADAGVDHAILVGHSMGAPVIRQFARLYPKKTKALVVVDGALRLPKVDPDRLKAAIARFTGPKYQENLDQAIDGLLGPKAPAAVRRRVRADMKKTPQHVAASAWTGMWDKGIWKEDAIKVPVLVVLAKSRFWTPEYEQFARKLAPKVEYHVLEGVGHFLMMEKPEAFNKILTDFLTRQGFLKP
jgi:pimeloyl-ACP methyl ester carboxylesterase